jgi:hypothetical protein
MEWLSIFVDVVPGYGFVENLAPCRDKMRRAPVRLCAALTTLVVLISRVCLAQYDTCHRWINCPSNCSSPDQHLSVTLAWLYSFEEFRNNMDKAMDIMNQFWGVYYTDYGPLLHMSLNYFCCYTDEELIRIAGIIADMEWRPLNVTFRNVTCNWDETEPDVVALLVLADDESQKELAAFVDRIEKQMIAQGIPVTYPRISQEPFHSTLGQVSLLYDSDNMVTLLNKVIPVWNSEPIAITWFIMDRPPRAFFAKSSRKPLRKRTF